MKVGIITACLFLFCFSSLHGQDNEISLKDYFSTGDFMDGLVSNDDILLEVKEKGSDFIYVTDILDPISGKNSENGKKAWATKNEGHDYVNLKYSHNAYAPNFFVQVDIKGRFCLAVMDPEFADVLDKAARNSTANIGGMTHTYDSAIGGIFLDQEGKERQIFIMDTKDLSIVIPYKANNAPINLLSKSTLKWLVGKENFKGSVKDYTVEEIIAIVEDLNQRQYP